MNILSDIDELSNSLKKRRTFAIISHPDAGKTTLTEKLLLYSGLLRTAGMVHGRKGRKGAASDWMAMEQERGISITASAMQFPYKEAIINVLDTPGHQDFSEDTYRTLTAADSAIMVIDAAKGVEKQTRKLFEVCRLRKIPVLTFINKMDMPGREPLDLMTEVEEVLGIHASAMNWPVGEGRDFKAVFDLIEKKLLFFVKTAVGGAEKAEVFQKPLEELIPGDLLSQTELQKLQEDLELLEGAGNPFDISQFLAGEVTPVFFGSALTNYGVEPFFDSFVKFAPSPGPRIADSLNGEEIWVDPVETPFSAYIFKLQANMDRRHRDSMAFMRVCSGRLDRDLVVKHHRQGREIRLSRPHSLVAGERKTMDVAYPGDIVGVINPGVFAIGDTVSLSGGFNFKPLPQFQPEVFARVNPKDVGKRKSFDKGVLQISSEGAIQLLKTSDDSMPIFAAVGQLQFEVLQYRLRDEYGVETQINQVPYECSAWLIGDLKTFQKPAQALITWDHQNRPVVLFSSLWEKQYAIKQNPQHQFLDIL